jgi:hypothetical protein
VECPAKTSVVYVSLQVAVENWYEVACNLLKWKHSKHNDIFVRIIPLIRHDVRKFVTFQKCLHNPIKTIINSMKICSNSGDQEIPLFHVTEVPSPCSHKPHNCETHECSLHFQIRLKLNVKSELKLKLYVAKTFK